MRVMGLMAVLLSLTGCYEVQHVEEVRTHVVWDPPTDTLIVDMRLVNVGAEMFGCAFNEVADCAERVRFAVEVPTKAEAETEDWPNFAPGRALVQDGSTEVTIAAERGEKGIDLVLHYRAPVGSAAASQTGVFVEREGKIGKEKARLVVEVPPERTVSTEAKRRRLRATYEQGARIEAATLVFAPKVREVDLVTRPEDTFTPLLAMDPGMEAALVAAGVLR